MSMFEVTSSSLRAKAEELAALNKSLGNQKETLEGQEQALISMWEGQAKESFHTAFIKDKGQIENFNSLIEEYIRALLTIAALYEETEKRNAQLAASRSY